MKIVIMVPTRRQPHPAWVASLEASVPLLDAAGIEHSLVSRKGIPYISYAMADMLHKAMLTDANTFVFLDDDGAWRPGDLLKLLDTEGDVCAGTYRYKQEEEQYMGSWHVKKNKLPILREDGAINAIAVPSGFLKVTRSAVRRFMREYPQLLFGEPEKPAIDLFNHGAVFPKDGRWWGQDYAFCRRWADIGGEIWLIPDLSIDHHVHGEDTVYKGNLHEFLLRQPGGSKAGLARVA